ncbi:helix-turn-helix domain-containing protein [uncultured Christiangramia sp.]|uniref:helix-turn-helix transcriptional regulator n=1 Tax=uncultured Christiangramia sp. TaxID=503836 RepID=UPI0025E4538A|nr:helix-turn-helix domain-containing protein [uncultured Christiangramia sp.]|tara:strand:+ start:93 stop:401 length:309 start_codon:yes stop_codon:yes gene_type:complete
MHTEKLNYHASQFWENLRRELREDVYSSVGSALQQLKPADPSSQEEGFINIRQVCSIFKISKSQVYNLRREHKDFPYHQIGKAVRYKQSEIESFLKFLQDGK